MFMTKKAKGPSMNHVKKNIAGNGLLVGLLIVALIGAAVLGMIFMNKQKDMDALPEASEITTETTTPPVDIATDEHGDAVPATTEEELAEATDVPPATTGESPVATEAVKIDVEKAFSARSIGKPDAPIKIVEYASLTCSHCAHFHNDVLPELKSKYIDTGKVYLEFREFPLNDPALKATLTARCLPEDKYEGFVNLLFKTQDHWAGGLDYMTSLRQNAKLAGMSDATFDACQAEPQMKLKVADSMKAAQEKWKISATPTFVINDGAETISGAQPLTEFERVFRKVSGDAVGEAPKVE